MNHTKRQLTECRHMMKCQAPHEITVISRHQFHLLDSWIARGRRKPFKSRGWRKGGHRIHPQPPKVGASSVAKPLPGLGECGEMDGEEEDSASGVPRSVSAGGSVVGPVDDEARASVGISDCLRELGC
ncbi:hypothetical protein CEXT_83011 [Caerostris extrusa]|uniref:Uncharacterized protein n=1 Tax=Caerostris extrusa TaxID=172846 RepID=A0AAV4SB86_CAEEX|nr:hypothetical protein CEXT_83011 [Caerostris extrusa]